MTTDFGISGANTNSVVTQQKSSNSLSLSNRMASTSSIRKASTISSTIPSWSKWQTLELRKFELENLLSEKNCLLQQILKQETHILSGTYERKLNLLETGKRSGTNIVTTSETGVKNCIPHRKGSYNLKLNKSNSHFNGKYKSEYDLAQENKLNNQTTTTNQNIMSMKKRRGQPQKTNSFHDSTSVSALSLTKSPSFEYNRSGECSVLDTGSHNTKYSFVRTLHRSTENLTNTLGVTQCDKYCLSPTTKRNIDGNGFIKASQNIKQCL